MGGNRGNTFTKYTKYSVKELESYVADRNACVQKLNWLDLVSVLPKYLGNIPEGVREYLTAKIGTYDRKVDGIILAFKNTKILSPLSAIRPNSVRLHMQVRSDFYVFRPQCGSVIEGTANYVSSNYISAVIYRVFNVTIKLGSQKQLRDIGQGSVVSFRIKSYDMKSDLPYIEGELIGKTLKPEIELNGVKVKSEIPYSNGKIDNTDKNEATEIRLGISEVCNVIPSPSKETKVKVEIEKPNKKRKHTTESANGIADEVKRNGELLSDEDMDKSIHDIIRGIKLDLDDSGESEHNVTLTNGDISCGSSSKKRKKKKKKTQEQGLDSMEAAILEKYALAESGALQSVNVQNDSTASSASSKSKKKKKKKKSKPSEDDDFESQIMASLMKYADDGNDEDNPQPNGTKSAKKIKKTSRKSVRFDDTITEALYNTFDTSELLEISQLQAPTLSSTLNDCGELKNN
ncbi:uncharacterized protein LOC129755473 [Uranotaenia lowii]|uniref:uncharacterized protein LOC129755473 n=1 Tax=Uranotaenia lowii TaxID=190385 RepID=UPI00247AB62E|nr:uncharacterized protein LOC129755473 [Uranotaenia lowii]